MPMLSDHQVNDAVNGKVSYLQLPMPAADAKTAVKLEKCIRQNDFAGAGRLLEKQRGVEAFDAEMLEFFIGIMHPLLGRSFSEFQGLARLAKKAAARVRSEGPANPAHGYCFEAELLSALVLGEWGRAMRCCLAGIPADAADASRGDPEFELSYLLWKRYPLLILQRATLRCFGSKDGAQAYKDLLELADLMPEYLRSVSKFSNEFDFAMNFLKALSVSLERDCDMSDGRWAKALLNDRFIPVVLKCLGSVSDQPAASDVRMAFVSLFIKESLEAPAVFETLWRIIVRTNALVTSSADDEARRAARDELWAAAAVILNAEPSVLRTIASGLEASSLGGGSASGLIAALCAAKDDAAVSAVADRAAERLGADPSDLRAGFVLCTALRAASPQSRGCGVLAEVCVTIQEMNSNPFIAFGRVLDEHLRGVGAELNPEAVVLVVDRLEAASRSGLVSSISSAAGRIVMKRGLRMLVENGAWETIVTAAGFAQFPKEWRSPAASLINCALGCDFARFVRETPEDEDFFSQNIPVSNYEILERMDDLKDLRVPRGAMEEVLRLEKTLSVVVACFPTNSVDGEAFWRDFGGEAGTGITKNELERLEAGDREVIGNVFARWTADLDKAWRAALAEGVDLTMDPDDFPFGMDDDEAGDDDSDEIDIDDENLKLFVSLRNAVEESLGEVVDFDFDFASMDAPQELENFLMLVRPKADPGRLLFVSGCPVLRTVYVKDEFEKLMNAEKDNRPFIVTMEVPADLLESETGRRALRRLVLMHIVAAETACAADRRRTFFLEGALLMTDTRFSNWKAFPTKRLLVLAHGNPDVPAYADDSTGWLTLGGDRLMPVVELLLLSEMEFKLFDRFGVRAVRGALPLDLLRLRRQRRSSAADIYAFKKPAGSRPAPVKLPPALRSLTCWAARPIMEGAAPCGGFFFAKPDLEDDSGWIFAVKDAPLTDYVRLPLADVLAVVPAALPHVVEGRGQRCAPSADGLGFTEIPTEDGEIFEADEADRALFSADEA